MFPLMVLIRSLPTLHSPLVTWRLDLAGTALSLLHAAASWQAHDKRNCLASFLTRHLLVTS
jgi:hypothetical protein